MQTELTDDSPCPVNGRHTGQPMKDVPANYLDWLDGQGWLEHKHPDVKNYIARNREAINQDLEREER